MVSSSSFDLSFSLSRSLSLSLFFFLDDDERSGDFDPDLRDLRRDDGERERERRFGFRLGDRDGERDGDFRLRRRLSLERVRDLLRLGDLDLDLVGLLRLLRGGDLVRDLLRLLMGERIGDFVLDLLRRIGDFDRERRFLERDLDLERLLMGDLVRLRLPVNLSIDGLFTDSTYFLTGVRPDAIRTLSGFDIEHLA